MDTCLMRGGTKALMINEKGCVHRGKRQHWLEAALGEKVKGVNDKTG